MVCETSRSGHCTPPLPSPARAPVPEGGGDRVPDASEDLSLWRGVGRGGTSCGAGADRHGLAKE